MPNPSDPKNLFKASCAILTISIFPPHASAAQTPVPSSEIGRNTYASTLVAAANETRTEYTSLGVPLDGVPSAVITRVDGAFAHPAFSDTGPYHHDSTRPSFFHRLLPKFHRASPHENLPALQLFYKDGNSVIVSPGSPMMPEGSERIHLARPDGRLHYTELPPLQESTWAGGFRIAKPPDGISLDQYARGLVAYWQEDLKAHGKHYKTPSVSSLKNTIEHYNLNLRENDAHGISR